MSDKIELRDHSQQCEHLGDPRLGAWREQDDNGDEIWLCGIEGCPGGKKIVMQKTTIADLMLSWLVPETTVWVEVSDE